MFSYVKSKGAYSLLSVSGLCPEAYGKGDYLAGTSPIWGHSYCLPTSFDGYSMYDMRSPLVGTQERKRFITELGYL